MVFSISAVLLLGIILIIVIRNKSIKLGWALLAALFGFFLAETSAAPPIKSFLNQIASTLNGLTH
ncbi:hypothetical protein [Phaeacidiphilus oryzae]|uniref:hypothetical protein n=1 Tax=Phaeacidiphilus oryzae TaxID=348818 RepID=UPI0005633EEB|nr:hypothetical protein [Phaeacidiphilus oryzae]